MNIAAFIFALMGAGLNLFQPLVTIPFNFWGGLSLFDITRLGLSLLSTQAVHDSDFWVIAALVVVFVLVAMNAIKCGFDALLRTEGKNPAIGLRLGVTTYVFVAVILFFISASAGKDNEFAAMGFNMFFPYTTPLIWAACYAIAAFCANADTKAEHNKTGFFSKNYEPIVGIEADALIKRGNLFLEDGDFEQADRYFEQALKQAPENSSAYLGKLMTELKVHNIHELIELPSSLKEQKLFQRALSFANDEEKIQLEHSLEAQNNAQEAKKQAEVEQTYIKALKMKEQISSSAYAQALINLLKTIAPYKDSEVLILEIEQKKKELDKKARKQWIIATVIIAVLIAGTWVFAQYKQWSERQTRIEAEKNEEKSRIEALKLELQGKN